MGNDMRDGVFQRKTVAESLQDEHPQRDALGVDHSGVGPQLRIKQFADLGRLNHVFK